MPLRTKNASKTSLHAMPHYQSEGEQAIPARSTLIPTKLHTTVATDREPKTEEYFLSSRDAIQGLVRIHNLTRFSTNNINHMPASDNHSLHYQDTPKFSSNTAGSTSASSQVNTPDELPVQRLTHSREHHESLKDAIDRLTTTHSEWLSDLLPQSIEQRY